MALSIKDNEADRLAREIATYTGETLTQAVVTALRERLARLKPPSSSLRQDVERIAKRCSALPVLDPRSDEQILGYGEDGLP